MSEICGSIESDVIRTSGRAEFHSRHITENSYLLERLPLFDEIISSPEDRKEIAVRLGTSLGSLLYNLNDTAPLDDAIAFRACGHNYVALPMRGICDDYCGERYAKFGDALTLRFYIRDCPDLPQWIFEVADWNFMDACRPGFVGYAYGSVLGDTVFISGIQSDLAARYAYILQACASTTDVRIDKEVHHRQCDDFNVSPAIIRTLRRVFQRQWLRVLLCGIHAYMEANKLRCFAVQQFQLTDEERVRGHKIWRIYRSMPQYLGSVSLRVRASDITYDYAAVGISQLGRYIRSVHDV